MYILGIMDRNSLSRIALGLFFWILIEATPIHGSGTVKVRTGDSWQDLDSSPAFLLDRIAGTFAPPEGAVRVEFIFDWSIRFDDGNGSLGDGIASGKRVVLELLEGGALIENSWKKVPEDNGAAGADAPLPFQEIQYTGDSMLQLTVQEDSGEPQLVYFAKPTLSQARGMRGDGFLVGLGQTATYSNEELSIWKIAASGKLTLANLDNTRLQLVSEGRFGRMLAEIQRIPFELRSLEIHLTQPGHLFHGVTLGEARKSALITRFDEFEYVEKTDQNRLGIASWKVHEKHVSAGGKRHELEGRMRILHCSKSTRKPPRWSDQLSFENKVADGMIVRVVNLPHMSYRIENGRLNVDADLQMEQQLGAAKLEPGLKPTGSDESERRSYIFWIVLLPVMVVVALVVRQFALSRGRF